MHYRILLGFREVFDDIHAIGIARNNMIVNIAEGAEKERKRAASRIVVFGPKSEGAWGKLWGSSSRVFISSCPPVVGIIMINA
jgi:hypothetical protein